MGSQCYFTERCSDFDAMAPSALTDCLSPAQGFHAFPVIANESPEVCMTPFTPLLHASPSHSAACSRLCDFSLPHCTAKLT